MDNLTKRERYQRMASSMKTERSSFDTTWRDLGDYYAPKRYRFTTSDRNRGDRRTQYIFDSTPRFAARTLQSGMHAGLTSPARPWMKLTTPDPDLAEYGTVKQWLHTVTKRMLSVFQRSNLYNSLPVIYGDTSIFANSAMALMADDKDIFRSYTYPLGSWCVGLDHRNMPTTFVREYTLSVRQVVETFAKRGKDIDRSVLSRRVLNHWDKGEYEKPIDITWVVTPNDEYLERSIGPNSFKWASCHFETGGSASETVFLRESGFNTFPIVAPRWDVAGEDTYGTDCPGLLALSDNKALQTKEKRKAQAIEKLVNPPLVGPESLRTQKTSLLPADITYVDERDGMKGLRPIHEVRVSVVELLQDINATQYRIQRAFYEDLFLMLANSELGQPVTAREVEERHEEKLLALGPVLERTNDELLDPTIDRVFALMGERGLIPEPPQELLSVDLKVEYISLMAQAQKLVGVVGQDRFLANVASLAQTWPEAKHKVRVFKAVDNYGEMLGVDPNIVVPDEEADEMRAAEAEAQADAAQAQQLQQAGAGMNSIASAQAQGASPLADLAAVVGSGAI